jgi:hypothetical protein
MCVVTVLSIAATSLFGSSTSSQAASVETVRSAAVTISGWCAPRKRRSAASGSPR